MSGDFLYENAPLIEVIAEIRWSLRDLASQPGAQIDPYYELFKELLLQRFAERGFVHSEVLIPADAPVELLAGQVHHRARRKAGSWPVFQIGPGILTANIAPPYQGWREFSSFLGELIQSLFELYPSSERTLTIRNLHLRYVDGFAKSHGFTDYPLFASEMLGIVGALPIGLVDLPGAKKGTFLLENRFPNQVPENSTGKVKLAPARLNGEPAAILELHCDQKFGKGDHATSASIGNWFDKAHGTLREYFDLVATDRLKQTFGGRVEIS